jgi:haloalkane dehalogenase
VLSTWDKPFLTLFSDSDPITADLDRPLQSRIPGAAGQPHRTIQGAGHFVQEDRGEEIAEAIVAFIEAAR